MPDRKPNLLAALNFASRLIDPDPSDPTRAGYTVANAARAAVTQYGLSTDEGASLIRMLQRREAPAGEIAARDHGVKL